MTRTLFGQEPLDLKESYLGKLNPKKKNQTERQIPNLFERILRFNPGIKADEKALYTQSLLQLI